MQPLEAEFLPTVATTGVIKQIGVPYQSERSNYTVVAIDIDLEAGPRKNIKSYLVFMPDWLKPDFSPKSLTDTKDRKVYRLHVRADEEHVKEKAQLRALAGDEWDDFVENTFGMFNSNGGTFDAIKFQSILNSVGNGQKVLIELKQSSQKTDELGDNGKPLYRKTDNYGVGSFFAYEDTVVASLEKRAKSARATAVKKGFDVPSFIVAWDEGGDDGE